MGFQVSQRGDATLVEVEGQGRLQPACAFAAAPGQKVRTESPRIARHRDALPPVPVPATTYCRPSTA